MQLPPYDTTAPLHRQQEPPRTATHSKTQKQDMQKTYAKNKERNFPAAAMILFSYLLRAVVHLPRGGATRNILLYLLYIALQAHSLRGIFLSAVIPGRGSSILKMRHEKTRRKVSIKKHCKKIFIFLIILHIKYEDKKTSRRQNIKK